LKELLSKLTNNDWGMGDEGFSGFEVDFSRFSTSGAHLPSGHLFSSIRIQVEQAIERLRNWRALKSPIRMPMISREEILDYHHKCWTIAAVFVNDFQN